jgi:hypothetical protein
MMTVVSLWIAAPILATTIALQWTLLRAKHRNELTRLHDRQMEHQHAVSQNIEQWKRQIAQLQHDLAAARLQIKQLSRSGVARRQAESHLKAALDRMLDNEVPSRRSVPVDGFAETQPSPYSNHDGDLLLR